MNRLLATALQGYHWLVSPWFPPACRFHPSCSSYAAVALRRHGLFKGGRLAAARLLRCHPFHPGGWDPVPGTVGPQPLEETE